MTNTRKTLLISDLHLQENEPDIARKFCDLLQSCDTSVDALYILGDLFETWVGDDDNTPFHRNIIESLHSATQKGLRIYFMYGNRDFLIGKRFLRETGCQLLADEEKISLYGTPVLLMHGDTLCTRDIAYLKARKLGRSWIFKFIFSRLPMSYRKNIAKKMREKSAKHTKAMTMEIMDVTQEAVLQRMHEHGVTHLIHGHTHRPDTHHFMLDGQPAARIVLGAWHHQGYVLEWHESGKTAVSLI